MATITQKKTNRYRIQFSMSKRLYEDHQENLKLAASMSVIIDFNRDFEKWFNCQVEQTAKLLRQLQENSTITAETIPATHDVITAASEMEVTDGNT